MKIEITDTRSHLTIGFGEPLAPRSRSIDREWAKVTLQAEVPGFQAAFPTEIRLGEIDGFYKGLRKLYDELQGTAQIDTLEGVLRIVATMDRAGHIDWTVDLRYPISSPRAAHLQFEMLSDQSFLLPLLAQLDAVMAHYL